MEHSDGLSDAEILEAGLSRLRPYLSDSDLDWLAGHLRSHHDAFEYEDVFDKANPRSLLRMMRLTLADIEERAGTDAFNRMNDIIDELPEGGWVNALEYRLGKV